MARAAGHELLDRRLHRRLVHGLARDGADRLPHCLGRGLSLRGLRRILLRGKRRGHGHREAEERRPRAAAEFDCREPLCYVARHMPLRQFSIGPIGEEVYPRFVSELAERFDDPGLDRNLIVRDTVSQLYLGRPFDEASLTDRRLPIQTKALLASFDPRNATMEAEYYRELDPEKWAAVKPLLWFWQMFDHSPVGRNVRLGTQLRAMLAQRVFRRCGRDVRIFHGVEFSFGYNLTVGNGVTIHRNVLIDDRGEVVLGDDVSISDYANIYSHSHAVEDIHDVSLGRTVIGDRARITYHAVVLSGVTVEADAMVGSMGVASRPIPAGVIAAGIPAKPIGQKKTR